MERLRTLWIGRELELFLQLPEEYLRALHQAVEKLAFGQDEELGHLDRGADELAEVAQVSFEQVIHPGVLESLGEFLLAHDLRDRDLGDLGIHDRSGE